MQHTLSRLLGALDISCVLDPTYVMLWDWSVDTWSYRQVHLQVVNRIMRYIKGTTNFGLFYSSSKKIEIVGYSDSYWGGD